tara:strand:+ start:1052 stop:1231 length:180 start_codon:yes stop_codon:yes gene_type:complete
LVQTEYRGQIPGPFKIHFHPPGRRNGADGKNNGADCRNHAGSADVEIDILKIMRNGRKD